jgi:hypothetical protein
VHHSGGDGSMVDHTSLVCLTPLILYNISREGGIQVGFLVPGVLRWSTTVIGHLDTDIVGDVLNVMLTHVVFTQGQGRQRHTTPPPANSPRQRQ